MKSSSDTAYVHHDKHVCTRTKTRSLLRARADPFSSASSRAVFAAPGGSRGCVSVLAARAVRGGDGAEKTARTPASRLTPPDSSMSSCDDGVEQDAWGWATQGCTPTSYALLLLMLHR